MTSSLKKLLFMNMRAFKPIDGYVPCDAVKLLKMIIAPIQSCRSLVFCSMPGVRCQRNEAVHLVQAGGHASLLEKHIQQHSILQGVLPEARTTACKFMNEMMWIRLAALLDYPAQASKNGYSM